MSKVYDFEQYKSAKKSTNKCLSNKEEEYSGDNIVDLNQYFCDKYRNEITNIALDNLIASIFGSQGTYNIDIKDPYSILFKIEESNIHINEVKKSTCEYCGIKYYGLSYLCKDCEQSLELI